MKLLRILAVLVVARMILVPELAFAARINEVTESTLMDRAVRFFTFKDPSLRNALLGSMLLGVCCGLMGAFLVVRKLSLLGDALSHAVLPGVALGFLWNMSKDPVAIFVSATLVGLLGAGTVQLLRATTRHKEDAALGFVLASFFGVGICLFTMIQNLPGGNKSGLDKFMFGQAAALGRDDVILLAIITALALGAVIVFYKEYALTSFDAGFARSLGMPVQVFHYSLMLLLAFAIVSSLQAVGVVLVSAMLVIPAAAPSCSPIALGQCSFFRRFSEWLPAQPGRSFRLWVEICQLVPSWCWQQRRFLPLASFLVHAMES